MKNNTQDEKIAEEIVNGFFVTETMSDIKREWLGRKISEAIQKAIAEERDRCINIVLDHYWDTLEYEGIGKKHGEGIAKAIRNLK